MGILMLRNIFVDTFHDGMRIPFLLTSLLEQFSRNIVFDLAWVWALTFKKSFPEIFQIHNCENTFQKQAKLKLKETLHDGRGVDAVVESTEACLVLGLLPKDKKNQGTKKRVSHYSWDNVE